MAPEVVPSPEVTPRSATPPAPEEDFYITMKHEPAAQQEEDFNGAG